MCRACLHSSGEKIGLGGSSVGERELGRLLQHSEGTFLANRHRILLFGRLAVHSTRASFNIQACTGSGVLSQPTLSRSRRWLNFRFALGALEQKNAAPRSKASSSQLGMPKQGYIGAVHATAEARRGVIPALRAELQHAYTPGIGVPTWGGGKALTTLEYERLFAQRPHRSSEEQYSTRTCGVAAGRSVQRCGPRSPPLVRSPSLSLLSRR